MELHFSHPQNEITEIDPNLIKIMAPCIFPMGSLIGNGWLYSSLGTPITLNKPQTNVGHVITRHLYFGNNSHGPAQRDGHLALVFKWLFFELANNMILFNHVG